MIQSFQGLRKEFTDFESRVQDQLKTVLDELRESDRRREEQHAEMVRMFRSYSQNQDQSHTPQFDSGFMSHRARSYDPLDPHVMAQQSAEVQHPTVGLQKTPEVQDPLRGLQNTPEVQDPTVGLQNSPGEQQHSAEVQDPPGEQQPSEELQDRPVMPQQTPQVQDQDAAVICRPVRLRKRGWQQTTPYTDPCKPKRAKSAAHKFKPDKKVDAEMLADYIEFKEDPTRR